MKNNKLLILIKKLNSKELKSFELFLQSPYHNKNTKCVDLFLILKPFITGKQKEEDLSPEYLRATLLSDKKQTNSSLSVLFSRLNKLLESFLIQEAFKEKEHYKDSLLLEKLIEKGSWSHFQQHYKKLVAQKNQSAIDTTFFHEQYLLERANSQFLQLTGKGIDFNLQTVAHTFDTYYLLNKIRLSWEMMMVSKIYKTTFDFTLLDEVLAAADLPIFKNNPLVQLYKQVMLLMKYPEELGYFEDYMQLLRSSNQRLVNREKYELYVLSANYCIQKVVNGQEQFRKVVFEIYREMIEQDILFVTTYLPENKFKNILSLGCRYHDWAWTEDFIQTYSPKLAPHMIAQAQHFGYGSLHFYQGHYDQALTHLRQDTNIDVFFTIDSKILLLKCFYELDYFNAFVNIAQSFRKFISANKKISAAKKDNFKNFIAISLKLVKLKENRNVKRLAALKEKIETTRPLSDLPWLLEKIGDLMA